MNRHRFVNPTSFINENAINPNNFTTIPRFNVWQSTLSNNQTVPTGYGISQPKKNYCSTCDMWTSEPYNNHQISPAHLAKKSGQRVNQNYPSSYGGANSSSNNVNVNSNNSTSKKKFKRSNKRGNQINRNKSVSGDINVDKRESILIDDRISETTAPPDDKSKIIVSSQSKESDKKLNVNKNRGQEMLIPVNGVFCALCEVFFANKDTAENDHCSSQIHCDAYEKLLKRVQESKNEKRPNENSADVNLNDSKRLKLTENKDRDFRVMTMHPSSVKDEEQRYNTKKDNGPNIKESDDVDQNSTTEFNAPDFSLEFPDDIEDYDEGDVQTNSERCSSLNDNREVCVVSKDA